MRIKPGFTLVEVLVVVVIIGILASIVIPQLTTVDSAARDSMVAENVRTTSSQIMLFQWQHNGDAPYYPSLNQANAPDEDNFVEHMCKATTVNGAIADPGTDGYPYGPYMLRIPANPVNGKNTIQLIPNGEDMPGSADDSHGWIFKPSTLDFRADCIGTGESGDDFYDY